MDRLCPIASSSTPPSSSGRRGSLAGTARAQSIKEANKLVFPDCGRRLGTHQVKAFPQYPPHHDPDLPAASPFLYSLRASLKPQPVSGPVPQLSSIFFAPALPSFSLTPPPLVLLYSCLPSPLPPPTHTHRLSRRRSPGCSLLRNLPSHAHTILAFAASPLLPYSLTLSPATAPSPFLHTQKLTSCSKTAECVNVIKIFTAKTTTIKQLFPPADPSLSFPRLAGNPLRPNNTQVSFSFGRSVIPCRPRLYIRRPS